MVDTRARGRRRPLRDARGAAVVAAHHGRATVRGPPLCARREATHPGAGRARRALRRGHAGHRDRRPAERRPQVGRGRGGVRHGGQGPSRAGGALDRLRSPSTACAHEWHGAHGNRDRSWGPRRWGGPKMWRWFSHQRRRGHALRRHPARHRRRRPPPRLGVGRQPGHLGGRVARRAPSWPTTG